MSRRLEEIIAPIVENLGYELWFLELAGKAPSQTLRIYIDAPTGIGVEDCEAVSTEVDMVLEVAANQGDLVADYAFLEVSSPGLRRPLKTVAHFARYVGEFAKVHLYAPIDGQRRFRGIIKQAEDETIVLDVDGRTLEFGVEDISKAILDPDFKA